MKTCGVIGLLFLAAIVAAQTPQFNQYDAELIATVTSNNRSGEIGFVDDLFGPGVFGPGSFMIIDDRVVFYDTGNRRLSITNFLLEVTESIELQNPQYLQYPSAISSIEGNRYGLFDLSNSSVNIVESDGVISVFAFPEHLYLNSALYINDTYFGWTDDGEIYGVVNPGPDNEENNRNILNTAETRALFAEGSGYETNGLTIDEANRLFQDGELVTRSYRQFYEYWTDRYGREEWQSMEEHVSLLSSPRNSATFLGYDQDGHWYWDISGRRVMVFNNFGHVFARINYQDILETRVRSAVDPSTGDLYFFEMMVERSGPDITPSGAFDGSMRRPIEEVTFNLYRIERQW